MERNIKRFGPFKTQKWLYKSISQILATLWQHKQFVFAAIEAVGVKGLENRSNK
jgi:hypothetical protein